jgi:hypothetical protein
MPLPNTALGQNEHQTVTLTPLDANGNPGTIEAFPPSWNVHDTTIATVTPASDGLSAALTTGSKPGNTQVDVTYQKPFGNTFTSSFTVSVALALATQFAFVFGTPASN